MCEGEDSDSYDIDREVNEEQNMRRLNERAAIDLAKVEDFKEQNLIWT